VRVTVRVLCAATVVGTIAYWVQVVTIVIPITSRLAQVIHHITPVTSARIVPYITQFTGLVTIMGTSICGAANLLFALPIPIVDLCIALVPIITVIISVAATMVVSLADGVGRVGTVHVTFTAWFALVITPIAPVTLLVRVVVHIAEFTGLVIVMGAPSNRTAFTWLYHAVYIAREVTHRA
jgi:hypothetical protein